MHKQRGVTMIGWIFLLIPVAIVLYAGIRVGPQYYDYYKISAAMEKTASELKSDETLAPKTIQIALEKRFDTGYIDNINALSGRRGNQDRQGLGDGDRLRGHRTAVRKSLPDHGFQEDGSHLLNAAPHMSTPEVQAKLLVARLGYEPRDQALFVVALTHRSAEGPNNERLEFLGDSVLNLLLSERLYREFPGASEGDLSRLRARLVSEEPLAGIAHSMQLGELLLLGSGELKTGGFRRQSILADAFEALCGALYLDGGLDAVRARIGAHVRGAHRGAARAVHAQGREDPPAGTAAGQWPATPGLRREAHHRRAACPDVPGFLRRAACRRADRG